MLSRPRSSPVVLRRGLSAWDPPVLIIVRLVFPHVTLLLNLPFLPWISPHLIKNVLPNIYSEIFQNPFNREIKHSKASE